MFYVYIIESETTGKWYYGYTERLEERIKEHNFNNGHFTGNAGPWKLIFKRNFTNKTDALAFEKLLKKSKNKTYLLRTYAVYFLTT